MVKKRDIGKSTYLIILHFFFFLYMWESKKEISFMKQSSINIKRDVIL